MSNYATYFIEKMRVTRPGKAASARHPERLYTVSGTFHSTTTDDKGKVTRKDKLTTISKNIDREFVTDAGFVLDVVNGILTIPEGQKGRTASIGLDADTLAAELAALRNPTE